MATQPYALACEGGLDKASSSFELLRRPGAATRLRNFEVDVHHADVSKAKDILDWEYKTDVISWLEEYVKKVI